MTDNPYYQKFKSRRFATKKSHNLVEIDLEDVSSTVDIRPRHVDYLIKTTWSNCCRIQRVLMIRGSDDEDAIILFETIKLCQNLVNCATRGGVLFAVAAGCGQQGVDFVNKDDTWFVLLRLFEQLTDALGTYTDIHLIEA